MRVIERYMGGTLYIRLHRAVEMLPLTREETIEQMKIEGIWPTAVSDGQGNSPLTRPEKGVHWWVERREFSNLKKKYWPNNQKG